MPSHIPSLDSLSRRCINLFKSEFEKYPEIGVFSPGRVNLIGEHTDYNDGFVLPMALPLLTVVVGRANNTDEVRIYTGTNDVDSPHKTKFSIAEKLQPGKPKWANYVKGVIAKFRELVVLGFDAVIVSSIPVGGGLSSSAALEVAIYTFLEALMGRKTTNEFSKARACQEAEHEFAGVPCGEMDQLTAIFGENNRAVLIDCRGPSIKPVRFDDPKVVVLITNSNVKHELGKSEYSIRRKQCEDAAKVLKKKSLRDFEDSDLIELEKQCDDKIIVARARHVVTENRRTQDAAEALSAGDYVLFGKLMIESHKSLRDDFEVSCKELDDLVEAAIEVEGVFGSRMTGGGFGGCTVTLVKSEAVDKCITNIKEKYSGDPVFYICKPSAGANHFKLFL